MMSFRSALALPAIVLGAIVSQLVSLTVTPSPAVAQPLADLAIGVDGTGSVQDPNSIVKTKLGPGAAIVQYPGSIFPIGPLTYDASVRIGIDQTKTLIRQFRAEHPHGTVHAVGHSQGARVLGDAIAELYADGMDTSFISAELLSDPRHPGTGIEIRLHGLFVDGYRMTGERGPMGGANVSWRCNPTDPVCNYPTSLIGVLGVPAAFVSQHGRY